MANYYIDPADLNDEQKAAVAQEMGDKAPPGLAPKSESEVMRLRRQLGPANQPSDPIAEPTRAPAVQPKSAPAQESEVMRLRRQLAGGDGVAQLGQAQQADRLTDGVGGMLDSLYSANTGGMAKAGPRPKSTFAEDTLAQRGMQQQRVKDLEGVDDNDPNSEQSKSDQAFIAQIAPGLAQQTAGMSSGQIRRAYPMLKEVMDSQQRLAAQKAAVEKEQRAETRRKGERLEDRAFREKESVLNRASNERAAGLRAEQHGADQTHQDDKDTRTELRQLSKDIPEDAVGFFEQSDAIRSVMNKSGTDIPGVGAFDSMKPGWLLSPEGKELVKNAKQMQLAYQKLVTGTGGGQKELAEIQRAGLDLGNEGSFKKGLEALERGYRARLEKTLAGYDPTIQQTYLSRVPSLAKALGRSVTGTRRVVFKNDPERQQYEVPEGAVDDTMEVVNGQ